MAGLSFNSLANSRLERDGGIPQVILPSKPHGSRISGGPKPPPPKNLVQLIKIQVGIDDGVDEAMGFRFKSPMPHLPFIKTTVHDAVLS
jgi:hypothetical protein